MGLFGWYSLYGASVCAALIGFSQAAIRTLPRSMMADIIDWDEAHTNERKEGTYFAFWNLTDCHFSRP